MPAAARRRSRTAFAIPAPAAPVRRSPTASMPPTGTHTIASVTANARCRCGTNSDASAAAFGIAPPSPRPATNRKTASVSRAISRGGRERQHAEERDAAEQRHLAAEPIADQAGDAARRSSCRSSPLASTGANAARRRRPVAHQCREWRCRAAGCRRRRARRWTPPSRRGASGSRSTAWSRAGADVDGRVSHGRSGDLSTGSAESCPSPSSAARATNSTQRGRL